jgi:sugar phosphate isomerase/epimerase
MDRVGIEYLSVFGMPPVQFVELAADLDCRYISANFAPPRVNPHNYPRWSLREDATLRREMIAAMRDRGVSISLGEGFAVVPDRDMRESTADLELMYELGVRRISAVSADRDLQRSFDQLAVLVEMAEARGMETALEFAPVSSIANLNIAVAALRHVGRPSCRLIIDIMHLARSGSGAADLVALDPATIGYVQFCDVPLTPAQPDYIREARYERRVPGTGDVPLLDILTALPRDPVLGLEIPQRSLAESGVGPHQRLGACVTATRNLLAQLSDPTDR